MPHRFLRAVLVSAFALALLAAPAVAADAVLLRRAYKPGDKYLAVMNSIQDITQTAADGSVSKIKQSQRTEMLLEVLAVGPDGAAQTKVTYQRMALVIESPKIKIDYDSGDPAKKDVDSQLLTISKCIVGKSITATITDRGEATAIGGIEPIKAEVLDRIPAGKNRDDAKVGLERSLGVESFKQQLVAFGIPMPAEAQSAGQTWNWDQNLSLGFADMAVHTACKVEAVAEKTVDVSVSATLAVTKSSPGFTVALDPAGRNTGKMTIDRANAAISSGSSQASTTMTVVVQNNTITSHTVGTTEFAVTRQ